MKKYSNEKITELKKFRKKGNSISDLIRIFSMPKTTIWHHIHKVKVPKKYLIAIKSRQGGSKIRSQKEWVSADCHAKKVLKNKKSKYHCSLMAMLYWAEGSKGAFAFVNTDGQMIKFYLGTLKKYFNISDDRLILTLRIFSNLDKKECVNYWANITGFPPEKFRIYLNDGGTRGKAKYGMCRLTVKKSGYLHKLTISLINNIVKDNTL